MRKRSDTHRLLDDALAEAAPAGFRDALLGATLHRVRRRRQWRRARRAGYAVALLFVMTVLLWPDREPQLIVKPPAAPAPYQLVSTGVSPGVAIVRTEPFLANVNAFQHDAVQIVSTDANTSEYRRIRDQELLALLAPGQAALVWSGPSRAELVFVNPEDERLFISQ